MKEAKQKKEAKQVKGEKQKKIYCYNYDCEHNEPAKKAVEFKPNQFYTPIGKKEPCEGICSKDFCGFSSQDISGSSIKYKLALCSKGTLENCERKDCVQNKDGICDRKEIWVQNVDVHATTIIASEHWSCWNRSDKGPSGHVDWSRFAKQKDLF